MRDLYLLAAVREKERALRRPAGPGRSEPPPAGGGPTVSRPRRVLARALMAVAERLWPEVGRMVIGGTR